MPVPRKKPAAKRRPRSPQRAGSPGRLSTVVVANIAKLIGLGIAVNEMVIRDELRQEVVAWCALALLGSQAAEELLLKVIDRIFAREDPPQ
jgi:hypothetical protein